MTDSTLVRQRYRDLFDQWAAAGPPPLGVSLSRWWDKRLVEFHTVDPPSAGSPPEEDRRSRDMDMVTCEFHLRSQVGDGEYRYDLIKVPGRIGDGCVYTRVPPRIGEKVMLYDEEKKSHGVYRVIDLDRSFVGYGSQGWPLGETESNLPDLVRMVVVEAPGIFTDEAPLKDET